MLVNLRLLLLYQVVAAYYSGCTHCYQLTSPTFLLLHCEVLYIWPQVAYTSNDVTATAASLLPMTTGHPLRAQLPSSMHVRGALLHTVVPLHTSCVHPWSIYYMIMYNIRSVQRCWGVTVSSKTNSAQSPRLMAGCAVVLWRDDDTVTWYVFVNDDRIHFKSLLVFIKSAWRNNSFERPFDRS